MRRDRSGPLREIEERGETGLEGSDGAIAADLASRAERPDLAERSTSSKLEEYAEAHSDLAGDRVPAPKPPADEWRSLPSDQDRTDIKKEAADMAAKSWGILDQRTKELHDFFVEKGAESHAARGRFQDFLKKWENPDGAVTSDEVFNELVKEITQIDRQAQEREGNPRTAEEPS